MRSCKTSVNRTGCTILEAEKTHYLMDTQYFPHVQCHLVNNGPSKVFIYIEKSKYRFKGRMANSLPGKAICLVDSYSSPFELAGHVSILSK